MESGDFSVPVVPAAPPPVTAPLESTSSTTNLPEADVQRIARAVATILKETGAPSSSPLTSGPSSSSAPPPGKSRCFLVCTALTTPANGINL